MVFVDLVQCVVVEEIVYFWMIECEWCGLQWIVVCMEEWFCVVVQCIGVVVEVCVVEFQQYCEIVVMCGIDQCFQCVGVVFGCEWCEWQVVVW